jgi:RNA polymerase sigma factor (sigma-70 family)
MVVTADPSDLVHVYLDEIGRYALLTPDDERRLAEAVQRGRAAEAELSRPGLSARRRRQLSRTVAEGRVARQEFVEANLRLVVAIARQYRRRQVELPDLVQEGNLGLMHAVDRFDWRLGNRFSTYATWWIRQSISRALDTSARSIRLPIHREADARLLVRTRERLVADLHRPPTVEELAVASGIPVARVEATLHFPEASVSLSAPLGEDGSELVDVIADPRTRSPEDQAADLAGREELARLVAALPLRLAQVIEWRYGLADGVPQTREEVARRLGVTRERVRQLEQRALSRLRRAASPGLADQLVA